MFSPDDPRIPQHHADLLRRIKAQGVEGWLQPKGQVADLEGLVYLCKFAFFTGILNKAEIGGHLGAERPEVKVLVRQWYDDHRAKGCGTC